MDKIQTDVQRAARIVRSVYPGPVGEILFIELEVWNEFGYRLGDYGTIMRLVRHIMDKAKSKEKEKANAETPTDPLLEGKSG
jgi:hypothetical protein